jgi:DNA-directed RNA polymerase specialized sigma24 family protein
MAFLDVLESMTLAERAAFILHDVFRCPFAEVAEITGRTSAACRQLAIRNPGKLCRWTTG